MTKESILIAQLNYDGHYDDQHDILVELLSKDFVDLEHGHQGDSWLWVSDDQTRIEIDTFYSMTHQIRTTRPDSALVKSVIATLDKHYSLTIIIPMDLNERRKAAIHKLLKGLETGEYDSVSVIHPEVYIQHNPQTREGRDGLAELFAQISKTSPRVNLVRTFSDGDYVFAHTEYDFSTRRIGFEVFRFEGEHTVEHWDNIQHRKGPNGSGHSMVDGVTTASDHQFTEQNRAFVSDFVDKVLIQREFELLPYYIDSNRFIEHNPELTDDVGALKTYLNSEQSVIKYHRMHRILTEGNFVLTVCEGFRGNKHTAYYDLYRLENNKIVEHWDTTETVPELSQWQNDNGKF